MMKRPSSLAVLLVLAACSSGSSAGPDDPFGGGAEELARPDNTLTAWVPTVGGSRLADSMARVPRRAEPGSAYVAELWAARGETESFAVAVRAPADAPIARLEVETSALTGPGGATIPADHVEAYRAVYQKVATPTGWEGATGYPPRSSGGSANFYRPSRANGPEGSGTASDPGNRSICTLPGAPYGSVCEIPDGLVPYKRCGDGTAPPCPGDAGTPATCPVDGSGCGSGAPSMIVPAGTNQEIWVDVAVPRGSARTPAGRYVGEVKVTSDRGVAKVWVVVHVWDVDLPLSPSFGTAFGTNTGASRNGAEQKYLAKHRIASYSPASFRTAWDELRPALGVPQLASSLGFWTGWVMNMCGGRISGGAAPSASAIGSWVASNGVPAASFYVNAADEVFKELQSCGPGVYAQLRSDARAVHAAGAKVLAVVNPIAELAHSNEDGTGRPAVDVFVASPKELLRESPWNRNYAGPDVVKKVREAGAELWTYNIWLQNSWGPKWMLDFSPVGYRAAFVNQAIGISGALVAEYNTMPSNPWLNGVHGTGSGGAAADGHMNGDSQFFYPGAQVGISGPTAHIRLKMFRDGIEDYELIQLLKTVEGGARWAGGTCPGYGYACEALVAELGGTDLSDYSTDSGALQLARRALGEALAESPDRPVR
jgi:hypothetical protein